MSYARPVVGMGGVYPFTSGRDICNTPLIIFSSQPSLLILQLTRRYTRNDRPKIVAKSLVIRISNVVTPHTTWHMAPTCVLTPKPDRS
jgi:hypothetical protein